MAKFYLINNVRVGTNLKFAGELIDDTVEDEAAIAAAGGVLLPESVAGLAQAAAVAQALRKQGAPLGEMQGVMVAAAAAGFETGVQRGTLAIASGTGTVNTGITLNDDSRILVTLKGRPTVTTNFAGHAVTARTSGGPGVGQFTVEFLVAAGTIDADAVGAVDWVIFD